MTALTQYVRLESSGIWRPDPEGQRRDVSVAFGDATLVIIDQAGRPLSHWSLAAVERLNPGTRPALYAPDISQGEDLEIADDLMIDAIEKVRRSISKGQPRPGRLRNSGIALGMSLLLGLAIFWLPGALTRQTLSVVAPGKRSEIGATLLGHIQRLTGPTCRQAQGTQALAQLKDRVLGPAWTGQIVVLPEGLDTTLALPGGIIVLGRDLIEQTQDPAVIAGHILAAASTATRADPLEAILTEAGLLTTMRMLTTGNLPVDVLQSHAARLLDTDTPRPEAEEVVASFIAAGVPMTPWAYSLDITGETVLDLIEADPLTGRTAPVILSDSDWISLQGICAQ